MLTMFLVLQGSDPGITVNIYYPTLTNYTIPGAYLTLSFGVPKELLTIILRCAFSQQTGPDVFTC